MTEQALATAQTGELRADGTFVIAKQELPNGWQETCRVGKLRIRGEREPRTINYNDYAKLLTFYKTQERLIKDRKHVMVALGDGSMVNTADITSLDLADEQNFTPKIANVPDEIRNLPIAEILLEKDGTLIAPSVTMREASKIHGRNFYAAKCHYRQNQDGTREYLTQLDQIPEALEYRESEEPGYQPVIVQIYKYGIPQR